MRPRRSSAGRAAVALGVLAVLLGAPKSGTAQGDFAKEGALFLLIPVGARSVGMGQAVTASEIGSEGIWGNPASLARTDRREFALNHSKTIVGTLDALVFVVPGGRAGVFSFGAYYLNYGSQDNTDAFGNPIGTSTPTDLILAGSYAATFGSRVRAGITAKFMQDKQTCSGDCTGVQFASVSGYAYDVGIQAAADSAGRLTFGAAVTSLGQAFQIKDAPQSDPLPTRVHAGAQYRLPGFERAVRGGELRVAVDAVSNLSSTRSWRAGVEFAYLKQLFLRAGYASGDDSPGASLGIGVQRSWWSVDFAQSTGGLSSDAGVPPRYLTFRARF